MAKFTFIDLFSGIGGFRIALDNAGGTCLGFSEIASDAINAYCDNFDEPLDKNFGDITKLKTLPKHDFMTAGVPCQSWSIAGKKLGFDDDRGQLWNDTLYLLNKVKPKAFIFENVKGLADPRNEAALDYIMSRIKEAGYHAFKFLLNAYDYGVPQTRVRIYIVGFKNKKYYERFYIPTPCPGSVILQDVLDGVEINESLKKGGAKARWSLSCNEKGFNDYFLFNDLRGGDTTIHSWDMIDTTPKEKDICYLLLRNRRKSKYGILDGNALSLTHFKELDSSITKKDLEKLVKKGILKHSPYYYKICGSSSNLSEEEEFVLSFAVNNQIMVDALKLNKAFRIKKIGIMDTLHQLEEKGIVKCSEIRYDFKNTKISTGLNGINRIFLPSSQIYPTMVASDTNDYITTQSIDGDTAEEFKDNFMNTIYWTRNFRKITKSEACKIQGFPADFKLPEARPRWMHLIGNSVAVPVVKMLANAVVNTGVFCSKDWKGKLPTKEQQLVGQIIKKNIDKQLIIDF